MYIRTYLIIDSLTFLLTKGLTDLFTYEPHYLNLTYILTPNLLTYLHLTYLQYLRAYFLRENTFAVCPTIKLTYLNNVLGEQNLQYF